MPSKNNTKSSGAKNQTKATSQNHVKTGNGSASNTTATESTQVLSKPPSLESKQLPMPNIAGVENFRAEDDVRSPPQAIPNDPNREGGVNKKKQKRRMKEAAKRAAGEDHQFHATEEALNVTLNHGIQQPPTYNGEGETNGYGFDASDYDEPDHSEPDEPEDVYYTDEAAQRNHLAHLRSGSPHLNGNSNHRPDTREDPTSKSKKKRKNKSSSAGGPNTNASSLHNQNPLPHPPPPPPPPHALTPGNSYTLPNAQPKHQAPKQQNIWNTSTAEERENIKEFWLSLGEEDRRSLVKVEKEAVLKKMKEQQKYSCSCTVCGRKRTAIEEELEVLYDAYYEELEQFANKEQMGLENAPSIPQPALHHPMSRQFHRTSQALNKTTSQGRLQEIGEGGDLGDVDEESDLGEEDDLSDDYDNSEEPPLGEQRLPNSAETDFFNFGSHLTVQGGILTVADDLLKNDGKKFIEMMEQLAERRMQREEEAMHASLGEPMQHSHTNVQSELSPDEEEEDEDEDYDSGEEDEFEEDDMEQMSEGQRMEEGRRMFQIFAARMFEQRVLTAYREKMAFERQQKLIEEVENEKTLEDQQKAKKLKEAQKKKDKKRQQKQAKEEEKAKREAELAAQEAAAKAIEEKKAEELRQKKEEQRRKKEAEKKALDDEKQRKEAEKQRRQQEAREQQQELERKQREQKEREKRKKEDARKKEREEREAKEQEAKEKKEREASERREREAKSKFDAKIDETIKPAGHTLHNLPVRPPPSTTNSSATTIPTVPSSGLIPAHTSSIPNSPHLPIAIPLVPKAPTPIRARQPSFQDLNAKSPKGSAAPQSSTTSPGAPSSINTGRLNSPVGLTKQPTPPQPTPGQPRFPSRETSPGSIIHPPGYPGMPSTSGLGFSPPISEFMQGNEHFSQPGSHGHQTGTGLAFSNNSYNIGANGPKSKAPNNMPPPPLNPTPGSHFGGIGQPISHRGSVVSHTHSRNTSTSSNHGAGSQPNPIGRPTPKQQPASVEPNDHARNGASGNPDVENGAHLGSSALLGDSEDLSFYEPRRGSMAPPGGNHNTRSAFGGPPAFPTAIGTSISRPGGMHSSGSTWSNQPSPFGPTTPSSPWPSTPGFGMQSAGSGGSNSGGGFGTIGSTAPQASSTQRAVTVRTLIANSCQKLSARSAMGPNHGWHPVDAILRDVNMNKPQQYGPLEQIELLALCDTVGNTQNGGGIFDIYQHANMGIFVRFTPGRTPSMSVGGEIGSPIGAPVGGGMFGGGNNHARPSFS